MRRTQRKQLVNLALYALFFAVIAALVLLADWGAIKENFFDGDTVKALWPEIITVGAKNTLMITAISFVGGLVLATILALMKLSPVAPYRWLATAYIEFFRGLPALIVIIIFGLGVPLAFQWRFPFDNLGAAIAALMVVSSAYMAETLRAGIQAVPKGQGEAAKSLGMGGFWTMVSVTMPQAIRIVIPPLTNEFVLLLKDTSLITVLGTAASGVELTALARDNVTTHGNPTPLLMAAVMYLVITLPITQLVSVLERRTQKAR